MKKVQFSIVILLFLFFASSIQGKAATKQITFKVTTTYKIQKGEKLQLYVKGHKKSKKIKWKSSNKKIATVTKKGVVKGKKGGTCKITATIGKKKYKVKISVITGERIVYVYDDSSDDSIEKSEDFTITSINATKKTLYEGKTFVLKIKGTKKKIKWESSNENIATVTSSGLVTAKSAGNATITASFEDSKYIYKHNCKITVTSQWMNAKNIEKNYGTSFYYFGKSIHISGPPSKDSLSGMVSSYNINDIPETMETDQIYGTEVRYKYDGVDILFNLFDLEKLELIK